MGEGEGAGGIHTDTTRSNVGGNHDRALASLELVQNPVTLVLLLVTVDGKSGPAILAKEAGDVVGNTLGAGEDEDLVGVLATLHDLLEMLDHAITLLGLGNDLDNLGDTMVGSQIHGTDVDLDEVGQEVGGQVADLLGPGSGPHESLTIRANLANDLANLGLETHVQHAISLIEDEVGHTTKVGLARLEHIDEATRGSNADLDTSREISNLRTLGDTTVDAGVANAGRLAELGDFLLNLDGQLAGRGENKDDRTIAGSEERLSVDVNDGGKAVGERLSRTGLGNTDDIATGEGHGPTLGLNGGRSREALSLDLIHNVARETSLVESLNGLGNIVAEDGNRMIGAELVDLGSRAVGNVGVLLVEGLLELGESAQVPLLLLETGTKSRHSVTATTTAVAAAAAVTTTTAAISAAAAGVAVGATTVKP